jgi:hypothetical protein
MPCNSDAFFEGKERERAREGKRLKDELKNGLKGND